MKKKKEKLTISKGRKYMKPLTKIKMWLTEKTIRKNRNTERFIDKTIKLMAKLTKKKITKQQEKEMRKTIYLNDYYSKKLIRQIRNCFNYYGSELAIQLVTNIMSDFTHQTMEEEHVDEFFDFLKRTVKGQPAEININKPKKQTRKQKRIEKKKVNYFG